MTASITGWKSRRTAVRKAREISTNPHVCELPDGTWIAVGDYHLDRGNFLVGARGICIWSSDLGGQEEQIDTLGFTEPVR